MSSQVTYLSPSIFPQAGSVPPSATLMIDFTVLNCPVFAEGATPKGAFLRPSPHNVLSVDTLKSVFSLVAKPSMCWIVPSMLVRINTPLSLSNSAFMTLDFMSSALAKSKTPVALILSPFINVTIISLPLTEIDLTSLPSNT